MKLTKNKFIAIVAVLISTAFISETAYAAMPVGNVGIQGGSLTLTPPTISADFGTVTLNASNQTVNATLSSWSVSDATGSNAGWHVTIQASQFTETGGAAYTLPTGSLVLSGSRTVTAQAGAQAVDATNGPKVTYAGQTIDNGSAITIIDTQANFGSGSYTVNEPANGLTLTVGASAKVDTTAYPAAPTPYTSTLTYSVVSGP